MDKQTSRQGKCLIWPIPGTAWTMVRGLNVHRLETTNQIRTKIIARQIATIDDQAKVIARWNMNHMLSTKIIERLQASIHNGQD